MTTTKIKATYELQPTAEIFLADLETQINKAKVSVWAQFYTFEADHAGKPIAHALINAAKRGVNVYLIIDHSINLMHNDYYLHVPRIDRTLQRSIVTEWRATKELIKTMQAAGVNVKMTNPLGLFRQKVLHRDHKKLVAVDSEQGGPCYVGGINPSDHNASWNDFMVKMTGSMAKLVQKDLEQTWKSKTQAGIKSYGDGLFITDSRHSPQIIPYALQLINAAHTRIIVESAYLWGKNLQMALQHAARRGVDVSIIVPATNNKKLFILKKPTLRKLALAGAQVYLYTDHGGMTHTKALLVDDTAMFGSNNFSEFLSGKINEANIATKNTQLVGQLEDFLRKDIAASIQLV